MRSNVELREAVLATQDLQLVYEAEQADASPVAIVRDVLSGRLYTWPDLRAWRRPLPGPANAAGERGGVSPPVKR